MKFKFSSSKCPTFFSRLFFYLALLTIAPAFTLAQNEARFWYFGNFAGLDFATTPPTSLSNGAMNTQEGCASISTAAGNLLFYTDGITVYNQNHVMMANGNGLNGNSSSTQSGVIVQQPGSQSLFYIFTQAATANPNGMCYSIVDMNLAAGLGSVTAKNVFLNAPSCEKIAGARHCNGTDVWVISHDASSNNFRTFLLSNTGLSSTPVISSVGFSVTTALQTLGQLKVSPAGNKIGVAIYNTQAPAPFEIFDFDPATGIVSNPLVLGNYLRNYGCEFSPDGSKFYGSVHIGGQLFQWDLCAGSTTAIINSITTFSINPSTGSMQLAPDGKIYIVRDGSTTLSSIDLPNLAGTACSFNSAAITLTSGIARLGLPNFVNTFFKPVPTPFTFTSTCLSASFTAAQQPGQPGVGCSSVSNTISSIAWDFGDPVSGASNNSTLNNPTHAFSAAGTYTVKLIVNYICSTDTVKLAVNVQNTSAPNVQVSGLLTICNGDKKVYTAQGASSYSWSTGAKTNIVTLSPTVSTAYTVAGTNSLGCTGVKIFTIQVNKCTSLDFHVDEQETKVYPNPFNHELVIEAFPGAHITVSDHSGVVMKNVCLSESHLMLDCVDLPDGVYTITISGRQVIHKKIVKISQQ